MPRQGAAPPVCLPCEKFAEYELRLNIWTCPMCGRRVTDEQIEDAQGNADG